MFECCLNDLPKHTYTDRCSAVVYTEDGELNTMMQEKSSAQCQAQRRNSVTVWSGCDCTVRAAVRDKSPILFVWCLNSSESGTRHGQDLVGGGFSLGRDLYTRCLLRRGQPPCCRLISCRQVTESCWPPPCDIMQQPQLL